jgi:hypothetical protein
MHAFLRFPVLVATGLVAFTAFRIVQKRAHR